MFDKKTTAPQFKLDGLSIPKDLEINKLNLPESILGAKDSAEFGNRGDIFLCQERTKRPYGRRPYGPKGNEQPREEIRPEPRTERNGPGAEQLAAGQFQTASIQVDRTGALSLRVNCGERRPDPQLSQAGIQLVKELGRLGDNQEVYVGAEQNDPNAAGGRRNRGNAPVTYSLSFITDPAPGQFNVPSATITRVAPGNNFDAIKVTFNGNPTAETQRLYQAAITNFVASERGANNLSSSATLNGRQMEIVFNRDNRNR